MNIAEMNDLIDQGKASTLKLYALLVCGLWHLGSRIAERQAGRDRARSDPGKVDPSQDKEGCNEPQ